MNTINKLMEKSVLRWLLTLAWMIFLTILLLQPLDHPIIPTGVKPAPPSFTRELYFSTIHGLIFSITAVLWTWTLHKHCTLRKAMWISVIVLLVYGIGTEYAQGLTPGRAPQRIDILANLVGATIGAWLLYNWLTATLRRLLSPTIVSVNISA
jgi:VanZ family protein